MPEDKLTPLVRDDIADVVARVTAASDNPRVLYVAENLPAKMTPGDFLDLAIWAVDQTGLSAREQAKILKILGEEGGD